MSVEGLRSHFSERVCAGLLRRLENGGLDGLEVHSLFFC
jgi:hypothetical protein